MTSSTNNRTILHLIFRSQSCTPLVCGTQTNVSAREPKQTVQVRPLTRENTNAHKYQESCV